MENNAKGMHSSMRLIRCHTIPCMHHTLHRRRARDFQWLSAARVDKKEGKVWAEVGTRESERESLTQVGEREG